ncbi:MAG: MFS transporter [Candidatus Caldatribacterium sp.]|uniref:MFS transporter n=1 Tax=Candidatus Caldatribacterium sp. TaxID=2282143 RepID=UPI0029979285|nr:MFS transporter [Candidatus Caldatribacterium sp.]MCX7730524.1 MFS transporter [Candidatus Caldatribacterium sp.]MDW8081836.1 MFS transporter [Candidatus Calescibacterium sp.]
MKKIIPLISFSLVLVVIGFGVSGIGSVIPEFTERFAVSYAAVGRVFLFHGFGYFLTLVFGGMLGDFVSRGMLLRLGLVLAALGFFSIVLCRSFSLMLYAFSLMGVGMGFIDCMVNPVAQSVFHDHPGATLNVIHAFFGLGSLLAPRLYAALRDQGYTFREFYAIIAIFTSLVALLFFFLFLPQRVERTSGRSVALAFTKKVFWLLGSTLLLYAAGVSTLNGWLVTYLTECGLRETKGAIFLSYFWLGLLCGRFVLAPFSERCGYLVFLRGNALGGSLGTGLLAALGVHRLWTPLFLFASGFLLSTFIPLALAYALAMFPESASTVSGWVLFNNGLGAFLFPWLFGFVGGRFGFRIVLAFVPLALFGVFLMQFLLERQGIQRKGVVTRASGRS